MTTSALLITSNCSKKQLQDLAPGPISEIYEAGTTNVGGVLKNIEHDATKGKFRALVLATLKVGVGTRALVKFLTVLAELEIEVLSAGEPWFQLGQGQAELVLLLGEILSEELKSNIRAGVDRARREGRGPGRPKVEIPARVFQLSDKGLSLRAIARQTGLGASTVGRALAARRTLNSSQGAAR